MIAEASTSRFTGREEHPVLPMVDDDTAAMMGQEWTDRFYAVRREAIARMAFDPFRYGYEPPIWKLADDAIAKLRARFKRGVLTELDLGGNRASKTERRAKRLVQNMVNVAGWKAWACQSTETASVQNQQSVIYKYLPPEWKPETGKLRHGAITKIVYSQSGGFTENVLVCPNGSECRFKFYEMQVKNLEGAELNEAWADELIPPDWIEALIFRLVTRDGLLGITFTPIEGYSSTVKVHLHGATTLEQAEAELLPEQGNLSGGVENSDSRPLTNRRVGEDFDGHSIDCLVQSNEGTKSRSGSSAPPAQNNFSRSTSAEMPCDNRTMAATVEEGTAPNTVQANAVANVRRTNSGNAKSGVTAGETAQQFEKVPRIQENLNVVINGQKSKAVIVYFHTADNPFGNYESMKATLEGATREKILTRAYGVPTKAMLTRFPLFSDLAHVISLNRFREIQKGGGSWYHFLDPCSGRNWFQQWIFVDALNRAFVAGESPSYDHDWAYIPGVGNPGPWAVAGNKADGEQGDGQKEWGWGYTRYIEEIERMERVLAQDGKLAASPTEGAHKIDVATRWIDARYGNARRTSEERSTTLIEDMSELGIDFLAAPSEKAIDSGRGGGDGSLRMINDKLYYEAKRKIDQTNQPHLYVVETCPNTVYALKEWTGKDGQHGACKDPIDTLRMFVLSGSEFVDEAMLQPITPWAKQFGKVGSL